MSNRFSAYESDPPIVSEGAEHHEKAQVNLLFDLSVRDVFCCKGKQGKCKHVYKATTVSESEKRVRLSYELLSVSKNACIHFVNICSIFAIYFELNLPYFTWEISWCNSPARKTSTLSVEFRSPVPLCRVLCAVRCKEDLIAATENSL